MESSGNSKDKLWAALAGDTTLIATIAAVLEDKAELDSISRLYATFEELQRQLSGSDFDRAVSTLADIDLLEETANEIRQGKFEVPQELAGGSAAIYAVYVDDYWIDPMLQLRAEAEANREDFHFEPGALHSLRQGEDPFAPVETRYESQFLNPMSLESQSGDSDIDSEEQSEDQLDPMSLESRSGDSDSDSEEKSEDQGVRQPQQDAAQAGQQQQQHKQGAGSEEDLMSWDEAEQVIRDVDEEPARSRPGTMQWDEAEQVIRDVDEEPARSRPGTMQWDEAEQVIRDLDQGNLGQPEDGQSQEEEVQEEHQEVQPQQRPDRRRGVAQSRPSAKKREIYLSINGIRGEYPLNSREEAQLLNVLTQNNIDVKNLQGANEYGAGQFTMTVEASENSLSNVSIKVPRVDELTEVDWQHAQVDPGITGYRIPYVILHKNIILGERTTDNGYAYDVFSALGRVGEIESIGRGRLAGTTVRGYQTDVVETIIRNLGHRVREITWES